MHSKVETEDLVYTIDDTRVIDGVSIGVAEAEVLAIIGPSGAGKSSFLRLLNRLDEPTDGTVYLDGVDYRTIDPQELRQRIGLLPQDPALRTGAVAENAAIGPRMRDEPIERERIERVLSRVDLDDYADRDVGELSGGEQQRVSIARSLLNDPEVLLLDEPTSSLDTATERQIETLLEELIRGDDLTCVLVTHDVDQARRLGDRIARFEEGAINEIDETGEIGPAQPGRKPRE